LIFNLTIAAVDHVTVYRWVQRFTPEFTEAARHCRHAPGHRRLADETHVKVAGQRTYLYRAIDQHGQVIDVLQSERRDLPAARRFLTQALRAGTVPAEVTTDRAPSRHFREPNRMRRVCLSSAPSICSLRT
jgi:transposase, IS6 family